MPNYQVYGEDLTAVASAIRTAAGTSAALEFPDDFITEIGNISGGGGGSTPDPDKPIKFIDYDGTLLYSYTASEFAALSSLPPNPSHTGLTAQGWNYTKNQINTEITNIGACIIGQMYTTSSGNTEIDVTFVDSTRLSPYLNYAANGTITIDWGDGTTADTVTGTSLTSMKGKQHTYASVGNYTITVHVVSGSWALVGSNYYTLLYKNTTLNQNRVYANCIKAIRIGSNTVISDYAFYLCQMLAYITIPSSITSIGNYTFYSCYSLSSITIPNTVTNIGI